jgi:hypothetical protein
VESTKRACSITPHRSVLPYLPRDKITSSQFHKQIVVAENDTISLSFMETYHVMSKSQAYASLDANRPTLSLLVVSYPLALQSKKIILQKHF